MILHIYVYNSKTVQSHDNNLFLYLLDDTGLRNRYCVLQYYFNGPEVNVVSKPHGLSKRSEPYFRTPKTALKHMRDVASHSTPKEALAKLTKEQGGEIETGRPTSLPRNRQQLRNLRHSATSHDSNVLYTLLLECKLAQGTTDAFIRDVKAAPTPQSVLFFDWQLRYF